MFTVFELSVIPQCGFAFQPDAVAIGPHPGLRVPIQSAVATCAVLETIKKNVTPNMLISGGYAIRRRFAGLAAMLHLRMRRARSAKKHPYSHATRNIHDTSTVRNMPMSI